MMMQEDWYRKRKTWRAILLIPFAWLFCFVAQKRKKNWQKKSYRSKLPVIIVGNITVGGTGKTPVVQAICQFLKNRDFYPAVITRGYGGKAKHYPFVIQKDLSVRACGDEPFMLNQILKNVPIVVSPKRVDAIKYIEKYLPEIDIIVSDDGLQHYVMDRDIEIAVVDGARMFGNGLCLPAGPLREPLKRLSAVDMIVVNEGGRIANAVKFQFGMKFIPQNLINLKTGIHYDIDQFMQTHGARCFAVAGIGNPKRFFMTLTCLGFEVLECAFSDHHAFTEKDFESMIKMGIPIIMTHKDAVKCQSFAQGNWYYLQILPEIDAHFFEMLSDKLSC